MKAGTAQHSTGSANHSGNPARVVLDLPVRRFKTPPCVPTTRLLCLEHVEVFPVNTETF